jgi:ABC-type branched-subunit amino acid transport system substrate-binding protein
MLTRLVALSVIGLISIPAYGQAPTLKVGMSAGLTGYAANIDRGWRDGAQLAIETLNSDGGILGRKIELIVEDNRSEPQESATVIRKLLSSDRVQLLVNGCISAGNFAGAPLTARAEVPMMVCSILPPRKEDVPWLFSILPSPSYEVVPRLAAVKKSGVDAIGIIHDPSPYANLQKSIAEKQAPELGLKVVGTEQYRQEDADLSVVLRKLYADGARAILKMGNGPSTLTAAKNLQQLGLTIPLLSSVDDLVIFRSASETLGNNFLFMASPTQVADALPKDHPTRAEADRFLSLWTPKYGDRDMTWAGRGWDAIMLAAAAMKSANTVDGAKVRDALEGLSGIRGTSGVYQFTADNHYGVRDNPLLLARIVKGKTEVLP